MELAACLEIHTGVTAVIGGGGKTTLLRTLGEELARRHRVLLCTTTKIRPFSGIPLGRTTAELDALRGEHRLLCAGTTCPETGKLTTPETPMALLAQWFDYVLVEADGSARLPMKAHAPYEPVIPPEANQTICLVGASGFGRSIREAAHRPALYALRAGVSEEALITPSIAAAVLRAEGLPDRVVVNQADTELLRRLGAELSALLPCPVRVGSLKRKELRSCWL